jgi:hypothetical protein
MGEGARTVEEEGTMTRKLSVLTVTVIADTDDVVDAGSAMVAELRRLGAILYDGRVVELGGHAGRVILLDVPEEPALPVEETVGLEVEE